MRLDRNSEEKKTSTIIGIVGGGQLALMLTQAAKSRNIPVIIQTPSNHDPAVRESQEFILSKTSDTKAINELAAKCNCVTFENEWFNIKTLSSLNKDPSFFVPSLSSLDFLVDKILQKKLLDNLSIPNPPSYSLASPLFSDAKLPDGWLFPVMAKAARGGYDGKGTRIIKNDDEFSSFIKLVDPSDWLIESWVPYDREFALVASRDMQGRIRTFPLVETYQSNQVCDWVIAPAIIEHSVEAMAINISSSILTNLNYVGVMAIEFFYGSEGLQVNEIAPRTHNSGHFSIEACNSSQFDQQICIAAGIPVPSPEMITPGAVMLNLLGLDDNVKHSLSERLAKIKLIKGAHLHWYGKNEEKVGRKLGHVTFILDENNSTDRLKKAKDLIHEVRSIWPVNNL